MRIRDRGDAEWLALCRDYPTAWTGAPDMARAERLHAASARRARFPDGAQHDRLAGPMRVRGGPTGRRTSMVRRVPAATPQRAHSVEDFWMVGRFALHAGRLDVARRMVEPDREPVRWGRRPRPGQPAWPGSRPPRVARRMRSRSIARLSPGYREAGCRFDVALTILDMATLIGPDEPAVRSSIPEGREILESLGARPLIERSTHSLPARGRTVPAPRARDVAVRGLLT